MNEKPLTDEDPEKLTEGLDYTYPDFCEKVIRLVAEVRRLRSDEWLKRAAEHIGEGVTRDGWNGESLPESDGGVEGDILAILRKHRDGKA